jgi:hypothetical protein
MRSNPILRVLLSESAPTPAEPASGHQTSDPTWTVVPPGLLHPLRSMEERARAAAVQAYGTAATVCWTVSQGHTPHVPATPPVVDVRICAALITMLRRDGVTCDTALADAVITGVDTRIRRSPISFTMAHAMSDLFEPPLLPRALEDPSLTQQRADRLALELFDSACVRCHSRLHLMLLVRRARAEQEKAERVRWATLSTLERARAALRPGCEAQLDSAIRAVRRGVSLYRFSLVLRTRLLLLTRATCGQGQAVGLTASGLAELVEAEVNRSQGVRLSPLLPLPWLFVVPLACLHVYAGSAMNEYSTGCLWSHH